MLHKELQKAELGGAEVDGAAVALHAVGGQVHGEVMERVLAANGNGAGAAEQGAHAGEQGVHAEGFDDVVVGAGVEAADGVLVLRAGGHHDDWQVTGLRAAPELAADLDPGHDGEHPVEQDDVGLGLGDAG